MVEREINATACARLLRKVATNRIRQCRDLDADLYKAFGHDVVRAPRSQNGISWRFKDGSRWVAMLRVSTDVSDAFAFIERVRPDALPLLCQLPNKKWAAAIGDRNNAPRLPFGLEFNNRPQALIVALLRDVSCRGLTEEAAP